MFSSYSKNTPGFFTEQQNSDCEKLLKMYANEIISEKSAVISAVMNGKLSEGINLKDDLARIVIIFGMPFPNIKSEENKLKYNFLAQKCSFKYSSFDLMENDCMISINQTIGRAFRHSNDYAAVLLVDKRFKNEKVIRKLPPWIQHTITDCSDYINTLRLFFNGFLYNST